MTIILDLPFQDQIQQSSGNSMEGFQLDIVDYGSKVSQTSFRGANAEASREEVFKVNWALIEYATPQEVIDGKVDQLGLLRTFYLQAQQGRVRYRPFEYGQNKIYKVIPNSLKVKNIAGCIFTATLDLEFLYTE